MKEHVKILILEEQTANTDWLINLSYKEGVQFEIKPAATESDFREQIRTFAVEKPFLKLDPISGGLRATRDNIRNFDLK
jgi:hypothetical protein